MENYKGFKLTIKHDPKLSPEDDVFNFNNPEQWRCLVDGKNWSVCSKVSAADAIEIAKRFIDDALTTADGRELTKEDWAKKHA